MNQQSTTIHPGPAADPPAGHPSTDEWIAYYGGQLAEAEQSRLQAHLTQCSHCVDLVLDLDTFAEPSPDRRGVLSFERAAAWRALAPTLTPRRRSARLAMAATLLFAVLGFSAWTQHQTIGDLETRVATLSQPSANVVIRDLTPHSRQRSAGGADTTTDLPADDRSITLILNLEEPTEYAEHWVRVVDRQGSEIRQITGLMASEFDNFYLSLPPGSLPAGDYELQLIGRSDGHEDLLEVYPIALR